MNLEKLNLALLEVEEELRDSDRWDNAPPFYFVIGAPRSGTTLLTQLLAYCFDFGYITNLAARFYLNPVLGMQLSKDVLGDTKPSFQSHYAHTDGACGIHEFGQFWMAHLGLSSSQDVDWMVPDAESAPLTLRALRAIQSEAKKPVVMKGIYPAYCYDWMNEHFDIRWVNVWRDPEDVCISILNARRKKKRSVSEWFGWHLAKSDRGRLIGLNPKQQVICQLAYFQEIYREMADVTVLLDRLCEHPELSLRAIVPDQDIRREPPELTYRSYK